MRYSYPLNLSFKLVSLTPQIHVRDAQGSDRMFVRQKMLKLKEDIGVFSDASRSQQLFTIKADRIIDFSARYSFTRNADGMALGAVKRQGMRSLWRASYMILDPMDQHTHTIREADPWIKVADGCLQSVPVVGMFAGYFLHPSYLIHQGADGTPVMKLTKLPAFFEGKFEIEPLVEGIPDDVEVRFLLSLIMMLLLERRRG